MIGVVAATRAGRAQADRLAAAWSDRVKVYAGPPSTTLPQAWRECDAIVAFLSTGATVRLMAPLLADKRSDPGVVCVDEAGRHAVALTGGHHGGANDLAADVARLLGSRPVITTATDSAGIAALDDLGWPSEGDVAAVARAILDGDPVHLRNGDDTGRWPLPALGESVRPDAADASYRVVASDRLLDAVPTATVVLRPPSLVIGVGTSSGAPPEELRDLVRGVLEEARLSPGSVAAVATVDLKRHEPAVVELAAGFGVPLTTYAAATLASWQVPTPSDVVLAEVGTPSVAEAGVLAAGAEIVVTKHKTAHCTVAVGRRSPRGRLVLVGIGPGARDLTAPRAFDELRRAEVVVGLDQYVDQVRDVLRPGTRVVESGLGKEEDRAREAVGLAAGGFAVALVGSGDAGIYAMASPTWEAYAQHLDRGGRSVDLVAVPGITAAIAASNVVGAPLGNDHAYISLSDLHTPWPVIERRVQAAADGDFVVCFYNPRSRRRTAQLPRAIEILAGRRTHDVPVALVRNASRGDESTTTTTLARLDPADVDMYTLVIVGNSASRLVDGHLVTPRGYRWLE